MRFEDLYDVPPVKIELLGGWYDGRRILIPDSRDTWLMPAPLEEPSITEMTDFSPGALLAPQPLLYRWTGSVRDDGTRVFRFEG